MCCLRTVIKLGKSELVEVLIESMLENHHTRKFVLESPVLVDTHTEFWREASLRYEKGNIGDARRFYNYSISFPLTCLTEGEISSLKANLAWCFFEEKDLEKAKRYVT